MTGEARGREAMVTTRRAPALRSQSIGVGLLAVRCRAAVKRVAGGRRLSDQDVADLDSIRDVLNRAADALRFGPASQVAPRGRQLTSVGLALSSVTESATQVDREHMATTFRQLADDVKALVHGDKVDNLDALSRFLTALSRAADRDTAQSGEVLVRNS